MSGHSSLLQQQPSPDRHLSAVECAALVRNKDASARELTQAAFDRIEERDRDINAFVFIDAKGALAAADFVDTAIARGEDPGPLVGVPIGVKDNQSCIGMPTKSGSTIHKDARPDTTESEHLARLRRAGAVPVGKVSTAEFGLDGVTHTLLHGTTRNPWNLSRTPGGSSGGSAAAVSAGMVPLTTAGDALGSIRCPAGFTGLVGLKPSMGRVPRENGMRDTACYGALTGTVTDTARYLDVVAGPHNRDRMSLPHAETHFERDFDELNIVGLRAAWSTDLGFAPMDGEVASICEAAALELAAAAGLILVLKEVKLTNVYTEWNALAALDIIGDFERAGILPDHIDQISPGPRSFIENAATLSECERSNYRNKIATLEEEAAALFEQVDIIMTPTACCEAYPAEGPLPTVIAGQDASATHGEPFTALGSICWNPSISIPAGVTKAGLPVGLLVTGPRHRDDIVLRLARIWEITKPWPKTANMPVAKPKPMKSRSSYNDRI